MTVLHGRSHREADRAEEHEQHDGCDGAAREQGEGHQQDGGGHHAAGDEPEAGAVIATGGHRTDRRRAPGTQRTERIRPTVTAPSTVATPAAVNSTG
jgi:hypothetical protein